MVIFIGNCHRYQATCNHEKTVAVVNPRLKNILWHSKYHYHLKIAILFAFPIRRDETSNAININLSKNQFYKHN